MNRPVRRVSLIFFCIGFLGLALIGAADAQGAALDRKLRALIDANGLTGDPAAGRTLPSINDPLAQLGMLLFFSKALGGDQDAACVSCHHPALGGGDRLPLSIGVAAVEADLLGPGRAHSPAAEGFDGGPTVPRNAPTTFNISLWDKVLFLDGRVESLDDEQPNGERTEIRTPDTAFGVADPLAGGNLTEAQARFPVTSPEEMRGFVFEAGAGNAAVRAHLVGRLAGTVNPPELDPNDWLPEFERTFGPGTAATLITFDNITRAIAAYERSQTFVETPWKRYVQGDRRAISNRAKQGAVLFLGARESGGFACNSCHSGDFFTDEAFHTLAMPQIGRGKGNDNGVTVTDDFGRFRETGDPVDWYAFRTPTLLNIELTGPYGHAGAYALLEDAIAHHLNPVRALRRFDLADLDPTLQTEDTVINTGFALRKYLRDLATGSTPLVPVRYTPAQLKRLSAFLETLTDDCAADRVCLDAWIPGEGDPDPDGLRVRAVDAAGRSL